MKTPVRRSGIVFCFRGGRRDSQGVPAIAVLARTEGLGPKGHTEQSTGCTGLAAASASFAPGTSTVVPIQPIGVKYDFAIVVVYAMNCAPLVCVLP